MSLEAAVPDVGLKADTSGRFWWRDVTRDQWRAFFAVFLGWIVDSFDFNILAFIVIDIQKSFTVDNALAGALGTVTLVMRLAGGTISGTLADKYGRKLPLTLSIIWFSIFAALCGFSTSYAMLFGLRALFGLGMGGEWAAGMPLVLEHWPAKLRGVASGLMLGGWYWGYLLASAIRQFIYPMFGGTPDLGWRVMFWVCIIPALFTLWIRTGVPESPVWLERQRRLRETGAARTDAVDAPHLSAGSAADDDSDHAGGRFVHVPLLLAELLVSHVPDQPAAAAIRSCRIWRRSILRRSPEPRCGDGCPRAGLAAGEPSPRRSCSASRRCRSSCTARRTPRC